MKNGQVSISELCHAAEGLSGTAASGALSKIGTLMQRAPAGRHFAAIATLASISRKAAVALEAGGTRLSAGRDAWAAESLTEALSHIDELAVKSAGKRRRLARPAAR